MSRTPGIQLVTVVFLGVASPALAGDLIVNGGFETGNFLGWTVPPNIGFPHPNAQYFDVVPDGPHSGAFYAQMASTQLQFVSQTLPTQAGQDYELSFWLRRTSIAGAPFIVRWEGSEAFGQVILGPDPLVWRQYTVLLHSNISGSFLEFGQAYFPGEFHIDDISVVPVPAPGAAPFLLVGGLAVVRRRRR